VTAKPQQNTPNESASHIAEVHNISGPRAAVRYF